MFTYPSNDLDNPRKLLGALGTFWSEIYHGRDLVLGKLTANTELAQRIQRDAQVIADNTGRETARIWRYEPWHMVQLSEQEMLRGSGRFARYDSTYAHDGEIHYSAQPGDYLLPIPANLRRCTLACSGISAAATVLTPPTDFIVADDVIKLTENPFEQGFDVENVYSGGEVVDRIAKIWLFGCYFDDEDVYQQYGYALDYRRQSSAAYRDAVASALDCIVRGTSRQRLESLLAAIFGITLCQQTGETVEQIIALPEKLQIITDRLVYTFRPELTPGVAVGQVLNAGQSLVEEFGIHELRRGQVPAQLTALTVPAYLLDIAAHDDIVFENTSTAISANGYANGSELITFALGGAEEDVEKFWQRVRELEIEHGVTLAAKLRELYGRLPTTINPLEFLVRHVWRWNCLVVRAARGNIDGDVAQIPYALIRDVQPPHLMLIFIITLPTLTDQVPSSGFSDGPVIIGVGTPYGNDTVAITSTAGTCKQLDFGCK